MFDKVFVVFERIEFRDVNIESFFVINFKEFIGFKDYDLLDIFFMDCYLNKSVQFDVVLEEIDIVIILEILNFQESFQFEQGKLVVDVVLVNFEEV